MARPAPGHSVATALRYPGFRQPLKEDEIMHVMEDRQHHWNRVRAELDLAFRADHHAAVAAHLKLSALHMRRLAELDRTVFLPEITN